MTPLLLGFNTLDWILVLVVLGYALSGYWQGFITGAFATVGLLAGGAFGIWLAPLVLGEASPSLWVSLGALFLVILSASICQALMQYAGARIRASVTWQPARAVDAVGGAALSAVAALLVAWALGLAVSGSRLGEVTPAVRGSTVLAKVDEVLPDFVSGALRQFNDVVGSSFFPQYLEPFAPEDIVEVDEPPSRLLRDPDVERAGASVFKVHGTNACGRGIEGSAFLYADDRLMTNAHVVAGVGEPEVLIDGESVTATVVLYDEDLDIAVLALDDRGLRPLPLTNAKSPHQGVAVLGYPEDGPFHIQPARIRSQQRLQSPDIYGEGRVVREVFSLRGDIRPGNSGGPIVSSKGRVLGVIFAASVTDDDTGYALTSAAVADAADQGTASTDAVGTGGCAS